MPRDEFASRDVYDVWLPDLAPSEALVKLALRSRHEQAWRAFVRRYRAEMKRPASKRLLALLAALSRVTDLAVGCYCTDESRCHRTVLGDILAEHGASLVR